MTYQLKSVGKMADFQTLKLYLPKFKSNVYLFLQGPSYRVLSVPGKKFDSNRTRFSVDLITDTLLLWA